MSRETEAAGLGLDREALRAHAIDGVVEYLVDPLSLLALLHAPAIGFHRAAGAAQLAARRQHRHLEIALHRQQQGAIVERDASERRSAATGKSAACAIGAANDQPSSKTASVRLAAR